MPEATIMAPGIPIPRIGQQCIMPRDARRRIVPSDAEAEHFANLHKITANERPVSFKREERYVGPDGTAHRVFVLSARCNGKEIELPLLSDVTCTRVGEVLLIRRQRHQFATYE